MILDQQGADMADMPGAPAGCWRATTRARKPTGWRRGSIPGVVSLVAELCGHQRQAAEELRQWKTHHEERMSFIASPMAVTLALLLTGEEFRGGSEVDILARHGEPAEYFPPMPRPRAATAGGWKRGMQRSISSSSQPS
jgi:hypothetical protein